MIIAEAGLTLDDRIAVAQYKKRTQPKLGLGSDFGDYAYEIT